MAIAPADMICFSLYSATHAMQQVYRPLLGALGITYPQYLVLSALWASEKPLTVKGIGQQVHLDSSTLTPLLKRLEAAGLVTRIRDLQDERRVQVNLTDKGLALREQAAHVPTCIVEKTGMDLQTLERLRDEIGLLATQMRDSAAPEY